MRGMVPDTAEGGALLIDVDCGEGVGGGRCAGGGEEREEVFEGGEAGGAGADNADAVNGGKERRGGGSHCGRGLVAGGCRSE